MCISDEITGYVLCVWNGCTIILWWRHQTETFSALLVICAGIHRSPVNSPHKGQWCGAMMYSLFGAWINGWVNNGEAGDLRRHRAIMTSQCSNVYSKSPWTRVLWHCPSRGPSFVMEDRHDSSLFWCGLSEVHAIGHCVLSRVYFSFTPTHIEINWCGAVTSSVRNHIKPNILNLWNSQASAGQYQLLQVDPGGAGWGVWSGVWGCG